MAIRYFSLQGDLFLATLSTGDLIQLISLQDDLFLADLSTGLLVSTELSTG